jgi:hypothetical protein
MTKTLMALAAAVTLAVPLLATPSDAADQRHKRRAIAAERRPVVAEVPVRLIGPGWVYPGISGFYGIQTYSFSPIKTDPLCMWQHQPVCNFWYCEERKARVCY